MTLELGQRRTNALMNISITDDILAEGTETFQAFLSLVGTNLPNITVDPNTTTVSIQDDDCKSTLLLLLSIQTPGHAVLKRT